MIVCRDSSISAFFLRAYAPHKMNTTGVSFADTVAMIRSVKVSHPLLAWEPAWWARTVRTALSSRTPCRAHASRLPCDGRGQPTSVSISLKMFSSEGGGFTPGCTEKHSPWAWPGPWYGSCPRINTRVSA